MSGTEGLFERCEMGTKPTYKQNDGTEVWTGYRLRTLDSKLMAEAAEFPEVIDKLYDDVEYVQENGEEFAFLNHGKAHFISEGNRTVVAFKSHLDEDLAKLNGKSKPVLRLYYTKRIEAILAIETRSAQSVNNAIAKSERSNSLASTIRKMTNITNGMSVASGFAS